MPGVLIFLGVGLALWAVVTVGGDGAGHFITKADLPRLSTLQLTKSQIAREIHLCDQRMSESRGLLSGSEVAGVVTGAAVGLLTSDFNRGYKAYKSVNFLGSALFSTDKCPGIKDRLRVLGQQNDDLSLELGLDPALTPADIAGIVAKVNPVVRDDKGQAVSGGYLELQQQQRAKAYANCVLAHGKNSDLCKDLDYGPDGAWKPGKAPRN